MIEPITATADILVTRLTFQPYSLKIISDLTGRETAVEIVTDKPINK